MYQTLQKDPLKQDWIFRLGMEYENTFVQSTEIRSMKDNEI